MHRRTVMTTIHRKFPLQYLQDLGLPDECEGGEVVRETIVQHRRWSVDHSLVVRAGAGSR